MKKERQAKLRLSKETVKNLESSKLQEVQGGACVTAPYRSCQTLDCSTDPDLC